MCLQRDGLQKRNAEGTPTSASSNSNSNSNSEPFHSPSPASASSNSNLLIAHPLDLHPLTVTL